MNKSRSATRSLEEWMRLVTECRQSGLSDTDWCKQHDISVSTFYNATTRLRKKACAIPDPIEKSAATMLDFTSKHQDVVKIDIQPEGFLSNPTWDKGSSMHLANSHTIEIMMDGVSIKLNNSADPFLLQQVIRMLRTPAC